MSLINQSTSATRRAPRTAVTDTLTYTEYSTYCVDDVVPLLLDNITQSTLHQTLYRRSTLQSYVINSSNRCMYVRVYCSKSHVE